MPTIYHYCDAQAFLAISGSGQLWVTAVEKLNDRTEVVFFLEQARHRWDKLSQKTPALLQGIEALDMHLDLFQSLNEYCVCCFSEDGDSVGQWIAYADRGKGFAIGFDLDRLRIALGAPLLDTHYGQAPLEPLGERWGLAPVRYGTTDVIEPHLVRLDELLASDNQDVYARAEIAFNYINQICVFYKHPAFQHEKEWRITYDATDNELTRSSGRKSPVPWNWRYGPYGVTPYLRTLDLRSCVTEVVVGPGNPDRTDTSYLKRFLQSRDMDHTVRVSDSPYR